MVERLRESTRVLLSEQQRPKRKSKSPKCNTTTDYGGIGTVDGAAWLGSASSYVPADAPSPLSRLLGESTAAERTIPLKE